MSSVTAIAPDKQPIFVVGRQHSGNTMLVEILGNAPTIRGFRDEGKFFEHRYALDAGADSEVVRKVVEMISTDADDQDALHQHLLREANQYASSPLRLWEAGMRWLANQQGATRCVQCATSYIFYVEEILQAFPDARLLYPIRNPLDIAASKKGRYWSRSDDLVRSLWGWNVGNRMVQQLANEHPGRVMAFRYEDFVARPERKLKKICSFCDVDFSRSYLDVPHTNRSCVDEDSSSEEGKGISTSRLYYFQDVLAPSEEAVVRLIADGELLEKWYPDLPSPSVQIGWVHHVLAVRSAVHGVLATLSEQGQRAFKNPWHVFDRASRRLKKFFG